MSSRPALRLASMVSIGAAALMFCSATVPAALAVTTLGNYASWTEPVLDDGNGSYDSTFTVTGSSVVNASVNTQFDDPGYNGGNSVYLDTNDSEWLAAGTPFGAVAGDSGPSETTSFYKVAVDTAVGDFVTSTTVVTFDAPVPASTLSFAVGDIDVDTVTVSAENANGDALTGTELIGTATNTGFNYCNVTENIPTECDGEPDTTDAPDVTTGLNAVTFAPSSIGAGTGVTGWIHPSAEISSITFVHQGGAGGSSIRLWVAEALLAAPTTPSPVALATTGVAGSTVALWAAAAFGGLGVAGLIVSRRRATAE